MHLHFPSVYKMGGEEKSSFGVITPQCGVMGESSWVRLMQCGVMGESSWVRLMQCGVMGEPS